MFAVIRHYQHRAVRAQHPRQPLAFGRIECDAGIFVVIGDSVEKPDLGLANREKPRLVTLCDVSDSVRNASRFMLQLVWNLQDCFSKVQSFAFVSEIAEVSDAFRTLPVERAVEYALGHARIDYHSRSDFGYAFARFCRESVDHLDRKTTLLVLGDARNNYNDPQPWTLRLMRERVKGIIWLNP